jgi:hypothetical protein
MHLPQSKRTRRAPEPFRSSRRVGKAWVKCVEATASPFVSQGCTHYGRSTSSLSLLRCQSVTGTTPRCFLRRRQPRSKIVLCRPLHPKSQTLSQPQRRQLLPRQRLLTQPLLTQPLLTQPLPPRPLLQLPPRRSPQKSRDPEFITRRMSPGPGGATMIPTRRVTMSPGPAGATNIPTRRVIAGVVRVTGRLVLNISRADTLASGKIRSARKLLFFRS